MANLPVELRATLNELTKTLFFPRKMLKVSVKEFLQPQGGVESKARKDGGIKGVDSEKGATVSNPQEAEEAVNQPPVSDPVGSQPPIKCTAASKRYFLR